MINRTCLSPDFVIRRLVGVFALAISLAGTATASANTLKNHEICAAAIDRAESGTSLPRELMTAISRVESGRWDPERKELSAWPWTVTNGSDGQYFPSKAKAIAHVRKLRARGISNIDVGCMQINLRYHPDAFENLDAALDPVTNARYAASLLSRLFTEHRSWGETIKRYHSSNPKFNRPYYAKVERQWNIAKLAPDTVDPKPTRTTLASSINRPQPEPVVRAQDDPRRLAAEAHRAAVIARHRAERARILADRESQVAAAGITATR